VLPPISRTPVVLPPPPSKAPPTSIRVNAGSGGAADPADRGTGLDTGTVLLLVGGLLMLTGGLMLARHRVS
jgi:LPXTG-motif cell wall-anchored protein